MSILTLPDSETAAQKAATEIRALITQTLGVAIANLRRMHTLIYENADGATPQQVFDAFGADAVNMRTAKTAKVTMISAIAVANGETIDDLIASTDYDVPAGMTVTNNGDGTVTVS